MEKSSIKDWMTLGDFEVATFLVEERSNVYWLFLIVKYVRWSTWKSYLQDGWEKKSKLFTGAGVELLLNPCKGNTFLGDRRSVVRKDEKFPLLVEKWRDPGHLTGTPQYFIMDMEVVDPDDKRTACLPIFRCWIEGAAPIRKVSIYLWWRVWVSRGQGLSAASSWWRVEVIVN